MLHIIHQKEAVRCVSAFQDESKHSSSELLSSGSLKLEIVVTGAIRQIKHPQSELPLGGLNQQ